jgi:hypothetical protein
MTADIRNCSWVWLLEAPVMMTAVLKVRTTAARGQPDSADETLLQLPPMTKHPVARCET